LTIEKSIGVEQRKSVYISKGVIKGIKSAYLNEGKRFLHA